MINKLIAVIFVLSWILLLAILPIDYDAVEQIAALKGFYSHYADNYTLFLLLNKFPILKSQGINSIKLIFISLNLIGILGTFLLYKNLFKTLTFLGWDSFFMFLSSFLLLWVLITPEIISVFWVFVPYLIIFLLRYLDNSKIIDFVAAILLFLITVILGNPIILLGISILIILMTLYLRIEKNNEFIFISVILLYIISAFCVTFLLPEYKIEFNLEFRQYHLLIFLPWIIFLAYSLYILIRKPHKNYPILRRISIITLALYSLFFLITTNSGFLILLWMFMVPYIALTIYKLLYYRKNIVVMQLILMIAIWLLLIIITYKKFGINFNSSDLFFLIISAGFIIVAIFFTILGYTYDYTIIKSTLTANLGIFLLYVSVLHPKIEPQKGIIYSAYVLEARNIKPKNVFIYKSNRKMLTTYQAFLGEINEIYSLDDVKKYALKDNWIFTTAEGLLEIDKLQPQYYALEEFTDSYKGVAYKYYLLKIQL